MVLEGFEGYILLREIMDSLNWDLIPDNRKGVYAIISPLGFIRDDFRTERGGSYQEKYPNYAISELEKKWVDNANILYIGKTDRTLRERISEYLLLGLGKKYSHGGGRAIWQLSESNISQLKIAWRICVDEEEPRKEEKKLVKQFEDEYKKIPFANGQR